jgi:hypothetical protein
MITRENTRNESKRIVPYSDEWMVKAGRVAMNFAPSIYPCSQCSFPFALGYQCTYCGNINPEGAE